MGNFTDINSAIEEARYLRIETKHHHVVTQKKNGLMHVRQIASMSKERLLKKMFSTQSDRFSMSVVNTN